MYDPIEERVLDFVGGKEDLEKKVIRCIGDAVNGSRKTSCASCARSVRRRSRLRDRPGGLGRHPRQGRGASSSQHGTDSRRTRKNPGLAGAVSRDGASSSIRPTRSLSPGSRRDGGRSPTKEVPPGRRRLGPHETLLGATGRPEFEVALATLLHDVGKPLTITFEDRIRFNRHEHVGEEMARDIGKRLKLSSE